MKRPLTLAALLALVSACSPVLAAAPPGVERLLEDPQKTFSVEVQNVPIDTVLKMLSKQHNLSIITAKNVNTTVTASFKDVTLGQALDSLVTINGFAYRVKGSVIEVYAPVAGEGAMVEKPVIQTFELQYANADKLKTLVKPFLSSDVGKVEAEIGRNALIVHDMPAAVEAVARVIATLDKPEPQVTIGAEIIEASINVNEKLGVDWGTRIRATGAARPMTWPFSARLKDNRSIPLNDVAGGDFGAGEGFPFPEPEDFTFGTLDATGLQAILEILKTDSGTNLIANPEITTLNNHEAKINIGNTVPVAIYTTNLETGVSAVTGFEDVETGTILTITPQVSPRDRTIKLAVKPEISEILEFVGQFDERPIITSRKAETTVRLRDGETLVIGGLVSEKTEKVDTKIPILGDIPLIKGLFSSKTYDRQKSSLYIFVTPRIMNRGVDTTRTKKAASRLTKDGYDQKDSGANDLRNPGSSPFQ